MTYIHHIISQERLLMLDLFEESFKQKPRVQHADRPGVLYAR